MGVEGARLLHFNAGIRPDNWGRYLREIQHWNDDKLEHTHDYIQWLFPLDERSGFNPEAPILDANTIREFRTRTDIRRNLRASFGRMLGFYGLEILESDPPTVMRARFFAERAANWIIPYNHNHLRITRILKSLRLLGLEAEAAAFFECLADIYRVESAKENPGISEGAFNFWLLAVRTSSPETLSLPTR